MKTYVITAAQNATDVNNKWWRTLGHIVEDNNAELVIIPFKYKYKKKGNDWFDPRVKPFMLNETRKIGKHLALEAVHVTPTSKHPLSSLSTYCGQNSGCFGFPRLTLETMVTSSNKARVLFTTGACTEPNYTSTTRGDESEYNHQLACQIISVCDKGYFYRREVEYKEGKAYDLRKIYTSRGVKKNKDRIVINPGDWHWNSPEKREDGGYREAIKTLIKELQVDNFLAHDFLDFKTQNHHSRDGAMRRIQIANKPEFVVDELNGCCDELVEIAELVQDKVIVVESNHDKAYERWLDDTSNFDNPTDAKFYHESWIRRLEQPNESMFKLHLEATYDGTEDIVKFISIDDNFKINNTWVHHGDIGPSGSRGSPRSFLKLASLSNSGHTHSPYRNFGVSIAGVTELEHGYNRKLGAWDQALTLIHKDGSVQMLHYVNKKICTGE